jgi:hypothetical protein
MCYKAVCVTKWYVLRNGTCFKTVMLQNGTCYSTCYETGCYKTLDVSKRYIFNTFFWCSEEHLLF